MPDAILRGFLEGGEARLVAVVSTETAREAARRHGAVAGAAVALARASSSGLLLATLTKDEERVTVQILGDGALGQVVADATSAGGVRAYARNPGAVVPAGRGRARLGEAIGRNGMVAVVRDLGLGEVFTGYTPIQTGEIDEDVEHYLQSSEQIESALACEAIVEGLDLVASGGVLVQALPGSGGVDVVRQAREALRDGALVRAMAGASPTPQALAEAITAGLRGTLTVLDVRPVSFHCSCTRERVTDMLAMLGPAEIDAMIAEQGGAQISCNFCGQAYAWSRAALEELRAGLAAPAPAN